MRRWCAHRSHSHCLELWWLFRRIWSWQRQGCHAQASARDVTAAVCRNSTQHELSHLMLMRLHPAEGCFGLVQSRSNICLPARFRTTLAAHISSAHATASRPMKAILKRPRVTRLPPARSASHASCKYYLPHFKHALFIH